MEIGTISGGTETLEASTLSNRAQLEREQFLEILVAQLSQQDPMSPLKNEDFLQQLVALQTLETTTALGDNFGKLIFQSEMSSAAGMIGKLVAGTDTEGVPAQGFVDRVVIDGQDVHLVLTDGVLMKMDAVREITQIDPATL